jgi:hypothetical protein
MTNDVTASQLQLLLLNVRMMNSNVVTLNNNVAALHERNWWLGVAVLAWALAVAVMLLILNSRTKILYAIVSMVSGLHKKFIPNWGLDPDDERLQQSQSNATTGPGAGKSEPELGH